MRSGLWMLLTVVMTWMVQNSGFVTADDAVYELRTYTCLPGRLDALNARFRAGEAKLFEKHGMVNVAYWNPTDGEEATNTLIYIVKHKSRDAAKASWDGFRNDPEWHAMRDSSEKDGKIVGKVESVFMAATDYSPKEYAYDPAKTYELRIYTTEVGRLDALNARFRNHTLKLFEKHGIENVCYFVPTDEPKSKNVLIYVIAHKDRDAAAASWKAFGADEVWKKVAEESQKDGKILAERPISHYMKLTDYSPLAN